MAASQSLDIGQLGEASSQYRSLAQAVDDATVVDLSDDKENEAQLKLNEHELRELRKLNSVKCIKLMRISPKEASCIDIPLCKMVPMPLIRPTLGSDIKRLEAKFSHGYRPGANVLYVSICDENGEERTVIDQDQQHWGPHWTKVNEEFEAKLATNPQLSKLLGQMFFICNRNH
jgi:hypothetical protein